MAAKSSQTAKNVVIALLTLWSVVSLIIIVVWATSPDLKSSAQCRAELQETTEKLEGAKVVYHKNKVALEDKVREALDEQDRQNAQILLLLARLNATNATLEECRQENVVLNGNITALEETLERQRQTEANLTAQLALKEDHIDALEQNLTQAFHQTETCFSLRDAAQAQTMAAQSQTRACEASQQYLQKQLQKCKVADSETSQQTTPQKSPSSDPAVKDDAPPLTSIPALSLLVCIGLRLLT